MQMKRRHMLEHLTILTLNLNIWQMYTSFKGFGLKLGTSSNVRGIEGFSVIDTFKSLFVMCARSWYNLSVNAQFTTNNLNWVFIAIE